MSAVDVPPDGTVLTMTELMRLIQAHIDRYGVTRATVARRAGMSPQTVQNWRDEIRALPDAQHLRAIAEVIGVPYTVVLDAALTDCGYRESSTDDAPALEAKMRRAVEVDPAIIDDLWFALNRIKAERALSQSQPIEPGVAADLLTRLLRQQGGAADLPMAARTEDYPKQD
jgi:transcriptional regulator with XRE-family HTH domain